MGKAETCRSSACSYGGAAGGKDAGGGGTLPLSGQERKGRTADRGTRASLEVAGLNQGPAGLCHPGSHCGLHQPLPGRSLPSGILTSQARCLLQVTQLCCQLGPVRAFAQNSSQPQAVLDLQELWALSLTSSSLVPWLGCGEQQGDMRVLDSFLPGTAAVPGAWTAFSQRTMAVTPQVLTSPG